MFMYLCASLSYFPTLPIGCILLSLLALTYIRSSKIRSISTIVIMYDLGIRSSRSIESCPSHGSKSCPLEGVVLKGKVFSATEQSVSMLTVEITRSYGNCSVAKILSGKIHENMFENKLRWNFCETNDVNYRNYRNGDIVGYVRW